MPDHQTRVHRSGLPDGYQFPTNREPESREAAASRLWREFYEPKGEAISHPSSFPCDDGECEKCYPSQSPEVETRRKMAFCACDACVEFITGVVK